MQTVVNMLKRGKTIAVVGLSPRPNRDSHRVARYLQEQGYRIIPVNPTVERVLGEKSYEDLRSIPVPVDVVDIFRKAEDVPPIVDQAIEIGASAVWMQLGIVNEEAGAKARDAGLGVVMDKCMLVEHRRLIKEGELALNLAKSRAQMGRQGLVNRVGVWLKSLPCFENRHDN